MDTRDDTGLATSSAPAIEPDELFVVAFGFWRSALLLTGDELGLFAALACGPTDAATLSLRLGLECEPVADLLDALIPLGVIQRQEGVYGNTPLAARFLDPARSSYIGPWLDMARAATNEASHLASRLRAMGGDAVNREPYSSRMWAELAALLAQDDGA